MKGIHYIIIKGVRGLRSSTAGFSSSRDVSEGEGDPGGRAFPSVGTEMCACRGNPSVSGKPHGWSLARGQFFSLWPASGVSITLRSPTSPGTCMWCPSPGDRHH